jgi:branched-subunit amino acid transport protein
MSLLEGLLAIAGMAAMTLLSRGLFFLPEREIPLPPWLEQALRVAPLAALGAVVAPEILLDHGRLVATWKEPRLWAAAAGAAWFFWQRGILGTIVCGMTVLLGLRFGLGW